MADFEDLASSVSGGISTCLPRPGVAGGWFHYEPAIIKRANKIGLKEAYESDADVQNVVRFSVW